MSSMMEYKGYHAKVEFSVEDGTLIGQVFGISDMLVFDGESVSEITEMFHQTIDGYIEFCKEVGKVPDKEFKGSLNIRISPESHKKLALCAEERGQSINQVINAAIEDYFCSTKPDMSPITIVFKDEIHHSMTYRPTSEFDCMGVLEKPTFTLIEGGKKNYGAN